MVKVKICGITEAETAEKAVKFGADALGFVFARSTRKIEPEVAQKMIAQLPEQTVAVGVFVNETPEKVNEIAKQCQLDAIQLHGEETVNHYRKISLPIIKAFGVHSHKQIIEAAGATSDYILLDSPKGKYAGGNGTHFDWNLLDKTLFEDKRIILAGGLHEENVRTAIKRINPYMVDVSSGVETNGKKDIEKIKRFIKIVKMTKGEKNDDSTNITG